MSSEMEVSTLTRQELNMDWTDYDSSSPASFHEAQPALITAYAVLWVIGLLGNIWVAFVVGYLLLRRRWRRSGDAPLTVQIYIFALCLCDMLVLGFLPLLLLDLIYGSWTIPSSLLCKLYLLSEGFNKFGAPWLLTALSGFCCSNIRRMARSESKSSYVANPEKCSSAQHSTVSSSNSQSQQGKLSMRFRSRRKRSASQRSLRRDSARLATTAVLICALAVIVAMSPVLVYADVQYLVTQNETAIEILAMKCVFQPPEIILTTFTVYSFLAGYLIPAFLFTYFYSSILYYVRKHRRGLVHSSGVATRSRSQRRYCRVTKTAIGLVAWMLAAWTPYWTIFLYFYFHPQTDAEESDASTIILSYFVHMLPYVNCSGYPILYTLLNKNIRSAYARAKMASLNRRRRRKLSAVLEQNSVVNGIAKTFRSSTDSTGDCLTQNGERKCSTQNETTSITLYQCDEYGSVDSSSVIRKISQSSIIRKLSPIKK